MGDLPVSTIFARGGYSRFPAVPVAPNTGSHAKVALAAARVLCRAGCNDGYRLRRHRGVIAASNVRDKDGDGQNTYATKYQPFLVAQLSGVHASRFARSEGFCPSHRREAQGDSDNNCARPGDRPAHGPLEFCCFSAINLLGSAAKNKGRI
jgi:hypothetical protein